MDNLDKQPRRILRSTFSKDAETSEVKPKYRKPSGEAVKALRGKSKLDEQFKKQNKRPQRKGKNKSLQRKGKNKSLQRKGKNKKLDVKNKNAPYLGSVLSNRNTNDQSAWNIKSKSEYSTATPKDKSVSWISGCCLLPSGEVILADFFNHRLKKLDNRYKMINSCDLPSAAIGMCYIGDNKVVVSLGKELQYADISGQMKLTNSVNLPVYCKDLTYHNSSLYIVNENTVFVYTKAGRLIRELFKCNIKGAYFQSIAVSEDGKRIYIASSNLGLITVDCSGNHLNTFFEEDLKAPMGICLDDRSNVFVCFPWLGCVIQVSGNNGQKLGEVVKKTDSVPCPTSLFFDRSTSSLTVCSGDNSTMFSFKLCLS